MKCPMTLAIYALLYIFKASPSFYFAEPINYSYYTYIKIPLDKFMA